MLFRPDDSKPLDLLEDEAWFEMQFMGRRRYILGRVVTVLNYVVIPVVAMVWGQWWLSPASHPYIRDPFIWIPLAIGSVIVGSLGAAHAFDTWRSYEKRAQLEDEPTPLQAAARLERRAAKFSLIGATLSTVVVVLEIVGHAAPWLIAVMGAMSLLGWRSVYVSWRLRKTLPDK